MSGNTNADINRDFVRILVDWLQHPDRATQELAKESIIKWLQAIADGGDPRTVILGGRPHGKDKYSAAVATYVQVHINTGMTQGAAVRLTAERLGHKPDSVLKTYKRHKHRVWSNQGGQT